MGNAPQQPAVKLFNALNGHELKQMIVREVQRQLDADTNFRQNLAYPVVSWEWHLKVKAYPHDPGYFTSQTAGEIRARQGETPEKTLPYHQPTEQEPVEVELSGGRAVDIPDAERQKEDMVLSEPAPGGVLVPRRPVARSVTIKKGVDVRTPAQREGSE